MPRSRDTEARHSWELGSQVYLNLSPSELQRHALLNKEAVLTKHGTLATDTGEHTGRSPKDKFIVDGNGSAEAIDWRRNKKLAPEKFDLLHRRVRELMQNRPYYVQDVFLGADPDHQIPARIYTERAWHAAFSRTLLRAATAEQLRDFRPEATIYAFPSLEANPAVHGTRTKTVIGLDLDRMIGIIGGTEYAGEIKKLFFTMANYDFPHRRNILTMHCGANRSRDGEITLFFGLSGTGKTTLSADPERTLIGDDEHGWGEKTVFNLEDGCYAKLIGLSQSAEPHIWQAVHRPGAILENVVIDPETGEINFSSQAKTENTRGAYPLRYIENSDERGYAEGSPNNIIFLTCDALGVLPPVSRLTPEQIRQHFLAGYTAKVAGTEKGVTEPEVTFSTCFGAPFLPLPPERYADLLMSKIQQSGADVWLVNTGWTGGAYGVGARMPINVSRSIVKAINDGQLRQAELVPAAALGLVRPAHCPGVPDELLETKATWFDPDAYERQRERLEAMFAENEQEMSGRR